MKAMRLANGRLMAGMELVADKRLAAPAPPVAAVDNDWVRRKTARQLVAAVPQGAARRLRPARAAPSCSAT